MRPETKIWLLCESTGKPSETIERQETAREAILTIAQWLMGVYMGGKIRIILARTQDELRDRRSAANQELMGTLESLLGEHKESDEQRTDLGAM